ncbi:MAG: AsmA-like C-terminal region-containing protein [Chthoniobacterales bacterium]|nr:AsmA-like C-terminal region-containing protein [Chthoniobacterales bacterium]
MPIPKKILLILAIVIVALAGVTLSINLIIQSATVQEQFHQTAQKIVGVPITMGRLSFNPFTGFHLSHVTITDASHRSVEVSVLDFMPTWRLLLSKYWGRSLNNIEKWGGILRARKVTLNNSFSLEHLKAHLKKRADSFLIDPFSSQVADGKLTGSFLLQEGNGLSPYQLNIHFAGISLKELMKGVQSIEGKVQGTFFMKGVLENLEKKEGEGMLEVIGMQFKPGGPLAQIGQLLGIQELQLLKFDEAVATYAVTPHQLVVKSLKLHSNNLIIRGHGIISYEGTLHLSALLLVNAKLQSRLQGLLPVAMLVPSGEAGFVALPFEITGSLDHPHSTLLEHVALPAINNNVQGLIQQIFKF